MNALVLGKGASGMAAAAALEEGGAEVEFADGCDIVVASPGVRVVSELQFGVERLARAGVKMLAVTGSKGKSSVVKLVADALNASGRRAVACGNYGLPVSAVRDCDWAVVEVSSFQMETTNLQPGVFVAATILNLQDDHLDRHGSAALYHALKRRLLAAAALPVSAADAAGSEHLFRGSWFDRGALRDNALAAIALMRAAGLGDAHIAAAFRGFGPLPHRLQFVGEFGGVKCIDDSKATSLAALAAGVEAASEGLRSGRRLRLVAGGRPKGDDPFSVKSLLTGTVEKVYLIGECAEVFRDAWADSVDCEICRTMERAVERAFADAEEGDTLLLSPGTASFDQFRNFGERGDVFARLAAKEGKKKR